MPRDKRFRPGPKARAPAREPPRYCPCCRAALAVLVRTVYAHAAPYSANHATKREVTNYVCHSCGIRVVIHAHPPRVTVNDRRFGGVP